MRLVTLPLPRRVPPNTHAHTLTSFFCCLSWLMQTQLRMEAFYTFNERFAKIRSKRIEKAVKGITGSKSSASIDEMPQQSGSGRKRKAKPSEDEANQSKVDTTEKPAVKKQSRRGRMKSKNSKINLEESRDDSSVRGRQRGRRGRGGRGKMKDTCYADAEISNEDGSSSENDKQVQHITEDAHPIRRVSLSLPHFLSVCL